MSSVRVGTGSLGNIETVIGLEQLRDIPPRSQHYLVHTAGVPGDEFTHIVHLRGPLYTIRLPSIEHTVLIGLTFPR